MNHNDIRLRIFGTFWDCAGGVRVLADASMLAGSGIPEEVLNRHTERVPPIIVLDFKTADDRNLNLVLDDESVMATLSFDATAVRCRIPWAAIRLLASLDQAYVVQLPLMPATPMKAPPKLRAVGDAEEGGVVLQFKPRGG